MSSGETEKAVAMLRAHLEGINGDTEALDAGRAALECLAMELYDEDMVKHRALRNALCNPATAALLALYCEVYGYADDAQTHAMAATRALCEGDAKKAFVDELMGTSLPKSIVALLSDERSRGREELCEETFSACAEMSAHSSAASLVLISGGFAGAFMTAMRAHSAKATIQILGFQLAWNVCEGGAQAHAFAEAGFIQHAVAAMEAFPSTAKLHHWACGAM